MSEIRINVPAGGVRQKMINTYINNITTTSYTSTGLFLDYNKVGITADVETATVYGAQIDLQDTAQNNGSTVKLIATEIKSTLNIILTEQYQMWDYN